MKKGIREGEREVGGDGVCGCSFGEPLKQETFQTSLYNQYFSYIVAVSCNSLTNYIKYMHLSMNSQL
jgi:hypothetical protein